MLLGCKTKIPNFVVPCILPVLKLLGDENVVWLDVPMADVKFPQIGKSFGDLLHNYFDFLFLERVLFDILEECSFLAEFHHDVDMSISSETIIMPH